MIGEAIPKADPVLYLTGALFEPEKTPGRYWNCCQRQNIGIFMLIFYFDRAKIKRTQNKSDKIIHLIYNCVRWISLHGICENIIGWSKFCECFYRCRWGIGQIQFNVVDNDDFYLKCDESDSTHLAIRNSIRELYPKTFQFYQGKWWRLFYGLLFPLGLSICK